MQSALACVTLDDDVRPVILNPAAGWCEVDNTDMIEDTITVQTPTHERIFGNPGVGLTAACGETGAIGAQTEQVTAQILAAIANDYEDMYVFHSFHLPRTGWDIDHLVLYRGVFFVIDDKQWESNSCYTLTDHISGNAGRSSYSCTALRDEEHFAGNLLKPRWYETQLAQYLPGYTFLSVVAVHGKHNQVTGDYNRYQFLLLAAQNLNAQLRYMLDSIPEGGPSRTDQSYVVLQLGQLVNLKATDPQPDIPFPISAPGSNGFAKQTATVDPDLPQYSNPDAAENTGFGTTSAPIHVAPQPGFSQRQFNPLTVIAFVVSSVRRVAAARRGSHRDRTSGPAANNY